MLVEEVQTSSHLVFAEARWNVSPLRLLVMSLAGVLKPFWGQGRGHEATTCKPGGIFKVVRSWGVLSGQQRWKTSQTGA